MSACAAARGGLIRAAVFFALLLAVPASAGAAGAGEDRQAQARRSGGRFRLDLDFARFSGDYGTDKTITLDVATLRLRWRWRRAELRLGFPYLRLSGGARLVGDIPAPGPGGPPPPVEPSARGPGDAYVRLDVDLVQGTSRRPWVTWLARVKLPTADESRGLGTGEADVEGGLSVYQPVGRAGVFLEGRYTKMGDPPDFDYEDVLRAAAGLGMRVGARGSVFLFWESRSHPIRGKEDRRDLSLAVTAPLGAGERGRATVALYRGLSETAEDWGAQLTLSF